MITAVIYYHLGILVTSLDISSLLDCITKLHTKHFTSFSQFTVVSTTISCKHPTACV